LNEYERRTQHLEDELNRLKSLLMAKGKLWAGTASTYSPGGLAVGANDTILTADSTATTGMRWSALASISTFAEQVQDVVGAFVTDSSSVDFTYNDVANTLTAAVISGVYATEWHAHRMSVDTGTRTIAADYSLIVPKFEIPAGTALEIAAGGILMTIG
jgi:hypothetical protein